MVLTNPFEDEFYERARRQGWKLYHSGYPDFILKRGNEIVAVEVKSPNAKLSREQVEMLSVLREAGLRTFISRGELPQELGGPSKGNRWFELGTPPSLMIKLNEDGKIIEFSASTTKKEDD